MEFIGRNGTMKVIPSGQMRNLIHVMIKMQKVHLKMISSLIQLNLIIMIFRSMCHSTKKQNDYVLKQAFGSAKIEILESNKQFVLSSCGLY